MQPAIGWEVHNHKSEMLDWEYTDFSTDNLVLRSSILSTRKELAEVRNEEMQLFLCSTRYDAEAMTCNDETELSTCKLDIEKRRSRTLNR